MGIDSQVHDYELHFGVVTRVIPLDPASKRGRVFFKSDTLTGGTEFSEPAEPAFPLAGANGEGFYWDPQVGDQIEIMINKANEHPIPRIVRMIYSQEDEPNEELVGNRPFTKGWATRQGHIILFDDDPTKPRMRLGHSLGNQFLWEGDPLTKKATELHEVTGDLTENLKGKVTRTVTGQMAETFVAEVKREFKLKRTEKMLNDYVMDIFGNLSIKARQGQNLVDAQGAGVEYKGGKIAVKAAAGELLDQIIQFLDQQDTLLTQLQAETHVGNLGYPTSPPNNAAAYATIQASTAAIKAIIQQMKL